MHAPEGEDAQKVQLAVDGEAGVLSCLMQGLLVHRHPRHQQHQQGQQHQQLVGVAVWEVQQ